MIASHPNFADKRLSGHGAKLDIGGVLARPINDCDVACLSGAVQEHYSGGPFLQAHIPRCKDAACYTDRSNLLSGKH